MEGNGSKIGETIAKDYRKTRKKEGSALEYAARAMWPHCAKKSYPALFLLPVSDLTRSICAKEELLGPI